MICWCGCGYCRLRAVYEETMIVSEEEEKLMMRRSFTLIGLLVIIVIIVLLFSLAPLLDRYAHKSAKGSMCASNLKCIFVSLYTYSGDFNGYFPIASFGSGVIAGEDKLIKDIFHRDTEHSVSENLWQLCAGDYAMYEVFVCPSSEQAGWKLDLRDRKVAENLRAIKDFPWWAGSPGIISYSFIQPWSSLPGKHMSAEIWRMDVDSHVVIGADGNNGKQPDYSQDGAIPGWDNMRNYVNSENHCRDGQNVLYGDGHVSWSKTAYVGVDEDNIFTALSPDYHGRAGASAGMLSVRPRDLRDTVLVPNREADLVKWKRKP